MATIIKHPGVEDYFVERTLDEVTAAPNGLIPDYEANRLILLIAFEGLGLKAVDWTAADGNDDSIAVMTRLGAEYMDTYPTPGRLYRDSEVRYRLTRRSHHVADSGPRNLRELLTCD